MSFRNIMYVLNCILPINSSLYVDASACSNSSSSQYTYYFLLNEQTRLLDFNESCRIEAQFPTSQSNITSRSASDVYNMLLMGFELEWNWIFNYNRTCPTSPNKVTLNDMQSVRYALEIYLSSFVFLLLGESHVMNKIRMNPPENRTYLKCVLITGGVVLARALLGISILLAIVVHKF
ncbi:hypothetical protein SLA2020_346350 [Shorea laevis]